MLIDGRKIKEEIKEHLKTDFVMFGFPVTLAIISVGNNPVTQQFIKIKKKFAASVGVEVIHKQFDQYATTENLLNIVRVYNKDSRIHGIVVQLPLPKTLDMQKILDSIAVSKDVDVLSAHSLKQYAEEGDIILPPVIGAVRELCVRYEINLKNKNIVVVGSGKLVGLPGASWFRTQGAHVVVADNPNESIAPYVQKADIILSGAGHAHLIKKDILQNGVVIFDAGASESKGVVVGDVDPMCAEHAILFTPVPGGIGPITVAILFRNLFILSKNQNN